MSCNYENEDNWEFIPVEDDDEIGELVDWEKEFSDEMRLGEVPNKTTVHEFRNKLKTALREEKQIRNWPDLEIGKEVLGG